MGLCFALISFFMLCALCFAHGPVEADETYVRLMALHPAGVVHVREERQASPALIDHGGEQRKLSEIRRGQGALLRHGRASNLSRL